MACGAAEAAYADHPPTSDEWNVDVIRAVDALTEQEEGRWFVETHEFREWERSDDHLVLLGTRYYRFPSEYAYAEFTSVGGRWQPVGWGTCSWRATVAPLGTASWTLDPDHPPDPDAATLRVLATEAACAGGQPPGDRRVDAVAWSTTEEVFVLVTVEPVQGGAFCPGNPAFPLEVELGGPLRDRTPVDASTIPGTRRHPDGELCTPRQADLEPQPGLPAAVEATRQAIHSAIVECDWEALRALADGNIGYDSGAVGLHGDPVPFWRGETAFGEPQPGTLHLIAGMLELSYAVGDTEYVAGEYLDTPIDTYTWPAVASHEHRSAADWDELLAVYDPEYVDLLRNGPEGYAGGLIVVIAEDGTWLAALVVSV